jgi:rRNA maturation RNase YbeY
MIKDLDIIVEVFNSSPIGTLPITGIEELAILVLSDMLNDRDERPDVVHLNIVFLSDKDIHEMNMEYLGHDYPTDAITFTLENTGTELEGEVYVGAETAAVQATEFNVSFENEIMRLVVHGCLHLLGMDDKTSAEKELMTQEEDRYLTLFNRRKA